MSPRNSQADTPQTDAYAAAGFFVAGADGPPGPGRVLRMRAFCCAAAATATAAELAAPLPPPPPPGSIPSARLYVDEADAEHPGGPPTPARPVSAETWAAAAQLREHLDQCPGCRWACITGLELPLPPPSPHRLAALMPGWALARHARAAAAAPAPAGKK